MLTPFELGADTYPVLLTPQPQCTGHPSPADPWSLVQVRVWDVAGLHCVATLAGHSGAVRALAACDDKVFSGSDDTTIKVARLSPADTSAQLLTRPFQAQTTHPGSLSGPRLDHTHSGRISGRALHGVRMCMAPGLMPPSAGSRRSV